MNCPRHLLLAVIGLMVSFFTLQASAQNHMPQITVTGNSEITAEPDQATINLSVRTQALSSAEAKKDNDQRINVFFDALNDLSIKDDAITAASINISAQYDYQNRQQRFIGFQVSRAISVEIEDLEMLHSVLDTAVNLRINSIQSISYSSSKEGELRKQARVAAIEDSKAKAQELAEAYDAKLGPIYNISYQTGRINQPAARVAMATEAFADASGGRFIPGDLSITDHINVVFDLITD